MSEEPVSNWLTISSDEIVSLNEAVRSQCEKRGPHFRPAPSINTMSTGLQASTSTPNLQSVLDRALKGYKRKTRKHTARRRPPGGGDALTEEDSRSRETAKVGQKEGLRAT